MIPRRHDPTVPAPVRPDDGSVNPGETTHDSLLVAACTALSRITGVLRVLAVGAVLGPTFVGNAYQVTNSLPNLIYYGFLAGSLATSLLVPALVRHIETDRPDRTAAVSGGFLGVIFAGAALVFPLAVLGLPLLLRLATTGAADVPAADQSHLAGVLVLMTLPQVFLYATAGVATAVLVAHRRFALASVAPALENLGVIAVLGLVHLIYGGVRAGSGVPMGELLLLGIGSTAAVALHAGVQTWGARRCGVRLRPKLGWRDPEVRRMGRRAGPALAQAGLLATQVLVLLLVASRIQGGAVALQIALNFYSLPIALVATPVGLALLPRLARLHHLDDTPQFVESLLHGLRLATFVAVPASVGYVALARPLAEAVAVGQMASAPAEQMIAVALTALSVGLLGQTLFFVSTQASYARLDTRSPLRSMALQTLVCLVLCGAAVTFDTGWSLLAMIGAAYAVGSLVGGGHLLLRVMRGSTPLLWSLWQTTARVLLGSMLMLPVVLAVANQVGNLLAGRAGAVAAVVAGSVAGVLTFAASQALLRAPELSWLRSATHGSPAGDAISTETGP